MLTTTATSPRLLAFNAVDHPGGAETTLMRLLAGLRARGWQIALTTPAGGPLRDQAARRRLRLARGAARDARARRGRRGRPDRPRRPGG